jgi:hypothetical protein
MKDVDSTQAESASDCSVKEKSAAEVVVGALPEAAREVEIGGRAGPDPTRYGDWEKGGRCIDF